MTNALPPKKRILFVCMGNICRSPAAECLMRGVVEAAGLSAVIECDSAGTIGLHEGNSPDTRMRRAGAARGIEIKGAARHVCRADLDGFDIILAMDNENMRYLKNLCGKEAVEGELRLFCDYVMKHSETEVPDPYYGGSEGFEDVLDILADGCHSILDEMKAALGAK